MNGRALYQAGKLDEAIQALGVELRDDPTDVQRRTFLFELLCFAGEYDRAEKQLDILSGSSRDAEMGALLYRSALHAERTRQEMFRDGTYPRGGEATAAVGGTWNGHAFATLEDADPRIGARLEIFAAGQYTWLPIRAIHAIRMEPPKRLRDLIWAPARVQTAPEFQQLELGEILLPVLAPLSWQDPDPAVRLGRITEWIEADGGAAPIGQKLVLVDGEEVPILELRELEIAVAADPSG